MGSRAFQLLCYPPSSRSQDLWRGQRAFRQVGILLLRVRALTVFMFISHRVSADADVEAQRKGAARLGTRSRSRRGGAGSLGQAPRILQLVSVPRPQTAPQIHWGSPATYQVSGDEREEPPAQLPGLGMNVEGSPPWVPRGLPLDPLCVQVPGPLELSLPAHHSLVVY